ncbi:MAG: sigma-54-dependent Fis family transcriptional regulator [Gammaproteobacteria bacterium]|nr:MAG: sigma-54-dependent Fis family transcriptional regulator [Gammaproteobacteria bacterium]
MTKINATALIVDDEQDIRELIEMAFASLGIDCILAPAVKDAIRLLKKHVDEIDFCITDMRLPDGNGLDLVAHIQKHYAQVPVCVITAHGNVELAVESLKKGAFDFVNKPFDLKQLRAMAKAALKLSGKAGSNDKKADSPCGNKAGVDLIGESPVMKKLGEVIVKLARSQAPVFIQGESGTGKEIVARSIHEKSARCDNAFVPVNCGAIPENLVESEFFGYKKGAFTGANSDHDGLFVAANGGTLFLDEVADLPLSMQVKLLRAIQERAIRPIGGDREIAVDVRILSATHKNLSKLVNENLFREDLYYRLNVISLSMPPLRKRQGDIEVLTKFILGKMAKAHNAEPFALDASALEKLSNYDFPGNVRELENVLERAVTFCEGNTLLADDIHFSNRVMEDEQELSIDLSDGDDFFVDDDNDLFLGHAGTLSEPASIPSVTASSAATTSFPTPSEPDVPASTLSSSVDMPAMPAQPAVEAITDLDGYMAEVETQILRAALDIHQHNRQQTADHLGISLRTLRYKLKKYGIT